MRAALAQAIVSIWLSVSFMHSGFMLGCVCVCVYLVLHVFGDVHFFLNKA